MSSRNPSGRGEPKPKQPEGNSPRTTGSSVPRVHVDKYADKISTEKLAALVAHFNGFEDAS